MWDGTLTALSDAVVTTRLNTEPLIRADVRIPHPHRDFAGPRRTAAVLLVRSVGSLSSDANSDAARSILPHFCECLRESTSSSEVNVDDPNAEVAMGVDMRVSDVTTRSHFYRSLAASKPHIVHLVGNFDLDGSLKLADKTVLSPAELCATLDTAATDRLDTIVFHGPYTAVYAHAHASGRVFLKRSIIRVVAALGDASLANCMDLVSVAYSEDPENTISKISWGSSLINSSLAGVSLAEGLARRASYTAQSSNRARASHRTTLTSALETQPCVSERDSAWPDSWIENLLDVPQPPVRIERDDLLDEVVSRLTAPRQNPSRRRCITLSGPSGIGKSTLAAKIVQHEKILSQFSDGIIWLDASCDTGSPLLVASSSKRRNSLTDAAVEHELKVRATSVDGSPSKSALKTLRGSRVLSSSPTKASTSMSKVKTLKGKAKKRVLEALGDAALSAAGAVPAVALSLQQRLCELLSCQFLSPKKTTSTSGSSSASAPSLPVTSTTPAWLLRRRFLRQRLHSKRILIVIDSVFDHHILSALDCVDADHGCLLALSDTVNDNSMFPDARDEFDDDILPADPPFFNTAEALASPTSSNPPTPTFATPPDSRDDFFIAIDPISKVLLIPFFAELSGKRAEGIQNNSDALAIMDLLATDTALLHAIGQLAQARRTWAQLLQPIESAGVAARQTVALQMCESILDEGPEKVMFHRLCVAAQYRPVPRSIAKLIGQGDDELLDRLIALSLVKTCNKGELIYVHDTVRAHVIEQDSTALVSLAPTKNAAATAKVTGKQRASKAVWIHANVVEPLMELVSAERSKRAAARGGQLGDDGSDDDDDGLFLHVITQRFDTAGCHYMLRWLPWHAALSSHWEVLRGTFFDCLWLIARVESAKSVSIGLSMLVDEINAVLPHMTGEAVELQLSLRLLRVVLFIMMKQPHYEEPDDPTAGVRSDVCDPHWFAHQLWGRLLERTHAPLVSLLRTAAAVASRAPRRIWLQPWWRHRLLDVPGETPTQPVMCVDDDTVDVTAVCVESLSRYVLSAHLQYGDDDDYPIHVWQVDASLSHHRIVRSMVGHTSRIVALSISADGGGLASASWDSSVRVWSVESAECLFRLAGDGQLTSVVFAPDGLTVYAGSFSKAILAWELPSEAAAVLDDPVLLQPSHVKSKAHSGWVTAVALSADGTTLASGSADKTVSIWDVKEWKLKHTCKGHGKDVTSLAFVERPTTAATAAGDAGKLTTLALSPTTARRKAKGKSAAKALDATEFVLVSGSFDKTARVWDVNTGKELFKLTGHVQAVSCVDPVRARPGLVMTGSSDTLVRVWDVSTGKCHGLPLTTGHQDAITGGAVLANGCNVVTSSVDGTLRITDITGEDDMLHTFAGHSDRISCVCISGGASPAVVSGSQDATLRVWLAETGELTQVLTGHGDAISDVSTTTHGTRVVSGSVDGTVRVWSLDAFTRTSDGANQCACVVLKGKKKVSSVALNRATGLCLLTVCEDDDDNVIRVWSLSAGAKNVTATALGVLTNSHTARVTCVTLNDAGTHAVSGSWDKSTVEWDVVKRVPLRKVSGMPSWVADVALGQDLSTVTRSDDTVVNVFRAGTTVQEFSGHQYSVRAIAMTDDCKVVLTGSADSSLRAWDVAKGHQLACVYTNSAVHAVATCGDYIAIGFGQSVTVVRLQ